MESANSLGAWFAGEWVSGSLADGWQLRDAKWQNDFYFGFCKTNYYPLAVIFFINRTDKEVDSLVVNGLSVIRKELLDDPEPLPIQDPPAHRRYTSHTDSCCLASAAGV